MGIGFPRWSSKTNRRHLGLATVFLLLELAGAGAHARSELHTFHCLHGCPAGTPDFDDIVVREIYTLASNDLTKFADWVAYRVTPDTIGQSGNRDWQPDPWLTDEETLEPADYTGAPRALRIDRGHQAPLAAFSGTRSPGDTNILSNITPQGQALNRGPWQRLEGAERAFVTSQRTPLYVITGPLYERLLPALPGANERHRVPSGYWKVITTEDGRVASFIMDTAVAGNFNHCAARVALEDVELRARLMLFPRLRQRQFRDLSGTLGCPGT